jgi:hypothetical protein
MNEQMTKNDKIIVKGTTGRYGYAIIESLIKNEVNESLSYVNYVMVKDYTNTNSR